MVHTTLTYYTVGYSIYGNFQNTCFRKQFKR